MSERTNESPDDTPEPWRRGLRVIGPAVWSWVVFAALCVSSLALAPRQQAIVIGQQASDTQVRQASGALQVGPLDYLAGFLDYLLFDFGSSYVLAPDTPALELALARAGPTFLLASEALLLVGVCAIGVRALARRSSLATEALGYLLAVPARVGLLTAVVFVAGGASQLGVVPTGPTPGVVGTLLPALAVALPFTGGAARTLARTGASEARAEWHTDAWLHAGWFLAAVVVAEQLFGIGGLGTLWLTALQRGGYPVLFAASALFVVPFLLASVARRGLSNRGTEPTRTPASSRAEPDGGQVGIVDGFRASRRATAGGLLLGVALIAGLLGGVATGGTPRPQSGLTAGDVLAPLGDGALAAAVALVVALGVGAALAIRVERRHDAVRGAIEPLAAIPFPVYLVFAVVAGGGVPSPLVLGAIAGLSITPFVFQRAVAVDATDPRTAVAAGVGVAATGAGITVLLLADLVLVRLPLSVAATPGMLLAVFVLAATPVALGLFLLADGRTR